MGYHDSELKPLKKMNLSACSIFLLIEYAGSIGTPWRSITLYQTT
jgi:hypothetical protein